VPTWAASLICTVVVGVGGYIIKYLVASSRVLGGIEQSFKETGRRLGVVEDWQKDRDAELVAYRNGYRQRSTPWWID
jgi:hypothetical protein